MEKDEFKGVLRNINCVWRELKKHPHKTTKGSDGISIDDFARNEGVLLKKLKDHLKNGHFCFDKVRPVSINNGKRVIFINTVRDRIVAKAILKVIAPKFKKYHTSCSYCPVISQKERIGGKLIGVPLAAKEIQKLFKKGYIYVFKTDIKEFFDNVNKKKMFAMVKKEVKNQKLLKLIHQNINYQIVDSDFSSEDNEIGIAQGSSLSSLLADFYLYGFDKKIESLSDVIMIRYVDDLVVLCRTKRRAYEIHKIIKGELSRLGLQIHPMGGDSLDPKKKKTMVKNIRNSPLFFLGLQFNFCQIIIPGEKKEQILEEIREILTNKREPLSTKTQRVKNKLLPTIEQYKQPHYDTQESIDSLVKKTQDILKKYYYRSYGEIFRTAPFPKNVKPWQVNRFFKFLGFDIDNIGEYRR